MITATPTIMEVDSPQAVPPLPEASSLALSSPRSSRRRSLSAYILVEPPSSPSDATTAPSTPPARASTPQPLSAVAAPHAAAVIVPRQRQSLSKSVSSPPQLPTAPQLESRSSSASASSLPSTAASASTSALTSASTSQSSALAASLSYTLSATLSSLSSSVTSFFRAPPLPTHPTPIPYYTLAEVAVHNTTASFWAIVHGRVYDLTHYLPLHPGGHRLLFQWGGKDCTGDFVGIRHSKRAVALLDQYWIGDVVGTKPMRSVPVGLGSAVKGPSSLGQGLKQPAPGLTAAEAMKLNSRRVQPAPRTYGNSNSSNGYRIRLTPPSANGSSHKAASDAPALMITLSPPPLPLEAPSSFGNGVEFVPAVTYIVSSVTSPYPQSRQLVLTRVPAGSSSIHSSSAAPPSLPSQSYVSVLIPSAGDAVKRQYTPIAQTPSSLTLLVRTYTSAEVGSHYLGSLTPGSAVSVLGPFSRFPHSLASYEHLVMIAMGSGITPMLQLLSSIPASSSSSSTSSPRPLLLFCCRSEGDIWMRSELDALTTTHAGSSVIYQLTQPVDRSWPHQGRLNERALREVFAEWGVDGDSAALYCVCGSDSFSAAVKRLLQDVCGVKEASIHVF